MKFNKKVKKKVSNDEMDKLIKLHEYKLGNHSFWKYDYESYNCKKYIDYNDFNTEDYTKQNYHKLSNFEMQYQYASDYYLHIPILAFQALGTNQAVLLIEMARLSINFPVNKYGFFLASSDEIEKDTGLTYTQQVLAADKLEQWGFIDIKTYINPINLKFFRFNDDFARKEYNNWKAQTGKFWFNIGEQYQYKKKPKKKDNDE